MSGLVARDGARRVYLEALSPTDSIRLLTTFVGDRASAEPKAVAELARRCAYLPLALRLAAEFAINRPKVTVADHVADLDAASALDRLDAGGDEHTSLRAVLSWSYHRLAPDAARAFRLLGAHPGREYDDYAIAALLDVSLTVARGLVRMLRQAHLLEEPIPSRHTMHDLLHAYAVELASRDAEQGQALRRLLDYYVRATLVARETLYPYYHQVTPDLPSRRKAVLPDLSDEARARPWVEAELPNLGAAARVAQGTHSQYSVGLSLGLDRFLSFHGPYSLALDLHRVALEVARATRNRADEARALLFVGRTLAQLERYAEAEITLRRADAICRIAHDIKTRSAVLTCLGVVGYRVGQHNDAITRLLESLALAKKSGEKYLEYAALNNLGMCYQAIGQYDAALELHEAALNCIRDMGDHAVAGSELEEIGNVYLKQRRLAEALATLRQALSLARITGWTQSEITALNSLAAALVASGNVGEAASCYEAALRLAGQTGERREIARAHEGLADVAIVRRDILSGRRSLADALAIYEEIGLPRAAGVRTRLRALADGRPSSSPA